MKPRFSIEQLAALGALLKEQRTKKGMTVADCVTKVNEWAKTHGLEPDTKIHDWESMEKGGHGMSAMAFAKCLIDLGLFKMESLDETLRNRPVPRSDGTRDRGKKSKVTKVAKKSSSKPGKKSRVQNKS